MAVRLVQAVEHDEDLLVEIGRISVIAGALESELRVFAMLLVSPASSEIGALLTGGRPVHELAELIKALLEERASDIPAWETELKDATRETLGSVKAAYDKRSTIVHAEFTRNAYWPGEAIGRQRSAAGWVRAISKNRSKLKMEVLGLDDLCKIVDELRSARVDLAKLMTRVYRILTDQLFSADSNSPASRV